MNLTPPSSNETRSDALEQAYQRLESRFRVEHNRDYETLVVPNGNDAERVHRWFRLKEAFSRRLLTQVIKDVGLAGRTSLTLLDPFAGSGTTAISLAELVEDGTLRTATINGFECNPFLHLVASTKLMALKAPSKSFFSLAKKVAALVTRNKVDAPPPPQLAAFHNPLFFTDTDLRRLLQLREAIQGEALDGASQVDVALAKLCLGGAIEPVSALRRDGRALRYAESKLRAAPVREFLRRAELVDEDMPHRRLRIAGEIALGDGRTLSPSRPRAGTVDLVLFSPPYPNNIDYTEVYKLESWLLEYISDEAEFQRQRLRTLYSHPSILRTHYLEGTESITSTAVSRLIDAIPSDRYTKGRRAMIDGYLSDMRRTLAACHAALKPGGSLVYVVGNSLHGTGDSSFVIAADLLIAEMATGLGFDVQRIDIARHLRRRQVHTHYLRESVVFLRRPA